VTTNYSLHKLAETDLEDIWLYTTEEWGIEQADEYIRMLLSRFSWISTNPLLGKKRDDIKPDYYCFPEGKHLIFYKITPSGIDIIGIPHQSMDILAHTENQNN